MLYPEAFKAIGNAELSRAFWLEQAAYAVMYEGIHGEGAPPNMSEEQVAQRKVMLEVAQKILIGASERILHRAIYHFQVGLK